MSKVVIVSASRTPIGRFGGGLKDFNPGKLGEIVLKETLKRANLDGKEVDEVIMGNVLSAGHGQNIARQSAIYAGIPVSTPAYAVNKVCGSGLKSVILGAQSILLGDSNIVLAGGTESMSQSPYAIKNARWGLRMNNSEITDLMITDGLWDVFNNCHMGVTAENIAQKYQITREEQDEFAEESQNKAERAIKKEIFSDEIVCVDIGHGNILDTDEYPRFGTKKETLAKLKPVFKKDGTVTAGNASGINDGAASVLLMSEEKAKEKNLQPLATIESYDTCGVSPDVMGLGPIYAIRKAIQKANIDMGDIDLIELNEAFASQSMAVLRELYIDKNKVNVNGGAIALGHPIGASGARILVTLLYEMQRRNSIYGLAALCIGGGQGIALVVKKY